MGSATTACAEFESGLSFIFTLKSFVKAAHSLKNYLRAAGF